MIGTRLPGSGSCAAFWLATWIPLVSCSISPAQEPVSFSNQVMAVLGKAGCNAGTCHGHASGKNGFKLSLRGYNPALDLQALTRDHAGRRVNLLEPEASLILLKPAGALSHGGGQRFAPDSKAYTLLERWLAEGARGDTAEAPAVERIEVLPDYHIVPQPGLAQQLAVTAHFSNGQSRDVTEWAIYELPSEDYAEVSAEGLVTTKAPGEAAVLVRFLGRMAISRIVVIQDKPDFAWRDPPVHNFIDGHVDAKLKTIQVLPSELSSDAEFLRRVSFDTIGLPPTPGEVRAFLADARPDKRARKIDELLDRPEFADQWALYWMDLLRTDESGSVMGRKGVWALGRWLRQAFDRNVPYDQFVRAFLTARGSQFKNPPAAFSRIARQPQLKAEGIAQLFLGVRIECAQCHDHPFDRWTQSDYNELARFFYQVRQKDGPDYYDEAQIYLEPERDPSVGLRFLDGSQTQWPGDRDRREALAEWMFGPARHWTARALVNRVWGRLFGRGIVEPVDDLRFSNPPVNEPLWNALADDFISQQYDFQHLVRTILNSRTYQASSAPNATNGSDRINFSHARLRRLTAEQLLDALSQATGVPEAFSGVPPGYRAAQIATVGTGSYFAKVFGRPLRRGTCTCERTNEPSLPQTLHLLNGTSVISRLEADEGTLRRLLASNLSDEQLVEELYLHVLSRLPNAKDRERSLEYLAASADRAQGAEDLLWALINSRQFVFNY